MRRFLINYIVSFVSYMVINGLGIVLRPFFWEGGILHNIILDKPGWMQFLLIVLVWICISTVPFALYFFTGTKLKNQGNFIMNYLSVTGSFLLTMIITVCAKADFSSKILWSVNASYGFLPIYILNFCESNILGAVIVGILPSLNIWLGMLAKQRRRPGKTG